MTCSPDANSFGSISKISKSVGTNELIAPATLEGRKSPPDLNLNHSSCGKAQIFPKDCSWRKRVSKKWPR